MEVTEDFTKWALTQKGYTTYNGKLYFYRFEFSILEFCIQNKQFRNYKNSMP
jgi:hypothetical protein